MAIYSLNVATVGRSTHAPGTAGAHILYIARENAATHLEAVHMPSDDQEARTWMDSYERESRSNARLMTKVRIALPRELDHDQNVSLARDFIAGLTGGRISSYFAIHDAGEDSANPHAHIVLIDKDIETGKRVLRLSDSAKDRLASGLPENGVSWVRERWEHIVNQRLAQGGHDAKIDRRSLEDQGVGRTPQIHIGPRAQYIDTMVQRPDSRIRPAPTPRCPERTIDYPAIDAGRTRKERNTEIIDLNLERDARSPHFETRVWATFERSERQKDRPVEAMLMAQARKRTLDERSARSGHATTLRDIRARRAAEAKFVGQWLRQRHVPLVQDLKARHLAERKDLAQQQDRLLSKIFEIVDVTGKTRGKRAADRMVLSGRHRAERSSLTHKIQSDRSAQREAIKARYMPQFTDAKERIAAALAGLRKAHGAERVKEDGMLQARARSREQARTAVQMQIDLWKRQENQPGRDRQSDGALTKKWKSNGAGDGGLPKSLSVSGKRRDRDRGPDFDR